MPSAHRAERQTNRKLAPATGPFARGLDRPAVKLNYSADKGQSDPQSTFGSIQGVVHLSE